MSMLTEPFTQPGPGLPWGRELCRGTERPTPPPFFFFALKKLIVWWGDDKCRKFKYLVTTGLAQGTGDRRCGPAFSHERERDDFKRWKAPVVLIHRMGMTDTKMTGTGDGLSRRAQKPGGLAQAQASSPGRLSGGSDSAGEPHRPGFSPSGGGMGEVRLGPTGEGL